MRRTVFSDGATCTPARLLRGQPSFFSTRCGRLAAHSPIAVNESRPASRAAIATATTHGTLNRTPRGSRLSGSRSSHSRSDAGTTGPGQSTGAAVTDWAGNGATFGTRTSAIPVLGGSVAHHRNDTPESARNLHIILPRTPAPTSDCPSHPPRTSR